MLGVVVIVGLILIVGVILIPGVELFVTVTLGVGVGRLDDTISNSTPATTS